MRLATIALTVALLAAFAMGCAHICKDIKVNSIPGCHLKGKGCKCIFHHKYQVRLTDPTTGTTGESGWEHSDTSAGDEAAYELLSKDLGCNCKTNSSIPFGKCHATAKVCFYFQSMSKLSSKASSFKIFGSVNGGKATEAIANNQTALVKTVTDLFVKLAMENPSCNVTAVSDSEEVLDAAQIALHE